MAGLLETLAVPRAAALPSSASLASIAGSSLSGRRSFISFSVFNGLKFQSTCSSVSFASFSKSGGNRRGARIVCEAQDTAVLVPAVNDQTWESLVIGSDKPVLVEFWAPWCGPCRMIHPVIDELSQEFADKFKFFKVNTDESPGIATRYGIRSIPTVMIFKAGEKKDTVIGAVPKTTLTACIEKFL
ncbi:Thioredoxin M4, chloroplastic [Capsicum chinense]|nr:Thioredoxin M4, chloroplastic [Capsicum chinense]